MTSTLQWHWLAWLACWERNPRIISGYRAALKSWSCVIMLCKGSGVHHTCLQSHGGYARARISRYQQDSFSIRSLDVYMKQLCFCRSSIECSISAHIPRCSGAKEGQGRSPRALFYCIFLRNWILMTCSHPQEKECDCAKWSHEIRHSQLIEGARVRFCNQSMFLKRLFLYIL